MAQNIAIKYSSHLFLVFSLPSSSKETRQNNSVHLEICQKFFFSTQSVCESHPVILYLLIASILLLDQEPCDPAPLVVLLHCDVHNEAGELISKARVGLGIPSHQTRGSGLDGGPQTCSVHGHQVDRVVEGLDSQHILVGDIAHVKVGSDPTIVCEGDQSIVISGGVCITKKIP